MKQSKTYDRVLKIFSTITAYCSYLRREDALFVKDVGSPWIENIFTQKNEKNVIRRQAISLRRYVRARYANLCSAWPTFKADIKRALH